VGWWVGGGGGGGGGGVGDMSGGKNECVQVFREGCLRKKPLEICGNRWKSFMGGYELD